MGLKCLIFLSYTLLLIQSTECSLKINTSGTGSHDQHIRCIATERKALLKLKGSLQSSYTGLLKSWGREGHEDDCCKWSGVECSNTTGHVLRLDLSQSYYACMINASLVELQHLSYLNLSNNDHDYCQIPEFIGHLSKLEELDLSYSRFGGRIPHQLGNLSRLKFLDLSLNQFNWTSIPESFKFLGNLIHLNIYGSLIGGKIQDQLGNLSKLQSLDLSYNNFAYSNQLEWVSHLYSLEYLQLDHCNLSKAFDWGQSLLNLPHLTELHLGSSFLPNLDAAPPILTPKNASSSLFAVDLSGNKINSSSIFTWLLNFNSSLLEINLIGNLLRGPIPSDFVNMPFLFYLDISSNDLEGELPSSFGPSLRYLLLFNNRLNGSLSNSITQLHKLIALDLSYNSFHGIISEDHLSNFTNMKFLALSSNSLTLSLGPYWIPPFQLYDIQLCSCNIGPLFPRWLQTQTNFYFIDISSNQISETLPDWFGNSSSKASYVNISNNKIHGKVPTEAFSQNPVKVVDLSSNYFEGWLPLFNLSTLYIDLSKNKFTGTLSSLCNLAYLQVLDLSDNDLSGELPQCWKKKHYTWILNLSNNNLTGNLQNLPCLSASLLASLQLGNNSFTGELPSSLSNCTYLEVLDIVSNMISGSIPDWIGSNLHNLRILILRSNIFSGLIPLNLCFLQKVQVMDLSRNNLTGPIVSCLHNSTVLTGKRREHANLFAAFISIVLFPTNVVNSFANTVNHLNVTHTGNRNVIARGTFLYIRIHERIRWKGFEYDYNRILDKIVVVDFSSNKLQGEIPGDFGSLVGLLQLNLSNNNLTGCIPRRIGEMSMLEVLDLSSNHLSGEIPQSISNLSFLASLDLSNNNLSGQIPKGTQIQTQSASSFMGNPGLCGDPLPKKCHQEEAAPPSSNFCFGCHKEEDEFISEGFFISMGVGFAIGLWGVLGCLLFHKSWSSAYFRFLNKAADWVYVRSSLIIKRILRR